MQKQEQPQLKEEDSNEHRYKFGYRPDYLFVANSIGRVD
jgi:hypothetical protein